MAVPFHPPLVQQVGFVVDELMKNENSSRPPGGRLRDKNRRYHMKGVKGHGLPV